MRRLINSLLIILTSLTFIQCERRPLVEGGNTHYVRVYVDEEIKNITTGFYDPSVPHPAYSSPGVLRVTLNDPESGAVKAERYLRNQGNDERGHYYDGYIIADPGKYKLVTYNFDTESTLIRDAFDYYNITAYTNKMGSYELEGLPPRAPADERIVHMPDHLFADRGETVTIPYTADIDTIYNSAGEHWLATSVVKSYYLQLRVRGAKWVSSAVALLTGLSGSATLRDGKFVESDPVTVYFDMAAEMAPTRTQGDAILYTTFNTFGKLPDKENSLKMTFNIVTSDGRALTATIDITKKFYEPDAIDHQWIILDEIIEIPEPENPEPGGGFAPEVGEWEDITTDIII